MRAGWPHGSTQDSPSGLKSMWVIGWPHTAQTTTVDPLVLDEWGRLGIWGIGHPIELKGG